MKLTIESRPVDTGWTGVKVQATPVLFDESSIHSALRSGADRRAVLLSLLASRAGELETTLKAVGLLAGEDVAPLQESFDKLKRLIPSKLVSEASRVCEISKPEVLVGLFAQLRHVADFAQSKEASLSVNLAAVERLIRNGRVDLFLP
jgi:hypothetical protein